MSDESRAEIGARAKRLRKRLAEAAAIDFFGANGREAAEGLVASLEGRVAREAPAEADAPSSAASLNGRTWEDRRPLSVTRGERVELTLDNQSMMGHPMHLHGHHFQVVDVDGQRLPGAVRDTVWVPPRRTVTVAFDAGNPGEWAFHCHHLYHMATGMMTTVAYEA